MERKKDESDKKNISKNVLLELTKIIQVKKREITEVKKPLFFDGRQYSVRVPKKFADAVKLDVKKHEVKFYLELPKNNIELPKLKAEVIEK